MKQASFSRFRQAEQVRNVWCVTPEEGTTLKEILRLSFWIGVRDQLRRGDRIEVSAEDNSWFATLIVRAVRHGGAQVGLVRHTSFAAAA